MIHRVGNNGNGGADGSEAFWWVLGGTVATITLYNVFKGRLSGEQAQYISTKESFPDTNSVAVRFGQLRDLWSMGYISSGEAISELETLTAALLELQKAGKASAASAQELASRIERMIRDILEYQPSAA